MKTSNYFLICIICALAVVLYGCSKDNSHVVNMPSGIVIHSEDFTGGSSKDAVNESNVIRLGDGYEKIELDLEKM